MQRVENVVSKWYARGQNVVRKLTNTKWRLIYEFIDKNEVQISYLIS